MTTKGRVKWAVLVACAAAWVGYLAVEFAFAASGGPHMSPQIHGDVIALLSLATLITTAVMVGDWASQRVAAPMDALRSTVLAALDQTRPIVYQLVQPPVVATATVGANGHGVREEVEKRPGLDGERLPTDNVIAFELGRQTERQVREIGGQNGGHPTRNTQN